MANEADRQFRDAVTAFYATGARSPKEVEAFAEKIASIPNLRPTLMEARKGEVDFGLRMTPSIWDRLFHPGTRSYRNVAIPDSTGSFEKRWRAGLYKQFGLLGKSGDPTDWDFRVSLGAVVIKRHETSGKSLSVLDYLDFQFMPAP